MTLKECTFDEEWGPSACERGGLLHARINQYSTGGNHEEFFIWGDGPMYTIGYDWFSHDGVVVWGCDLPGSIVAPHTCSEPITFKMSLGLGGSFELTSSSALTLEFTDYSNIGGALTGCTVRGPAPDVFPEYEPCVRVPEPSSLLLLTMGGLGLAYVRTRRA